MCVLIWGAVHLGTPGVGIVDGSLALARRLIDFFDLPVPIPYATQWKWFSRGWPIQNGANAESKPPMLYQISECVKCMCVCVWKHLGTRCWLFRTRLDENKWWPQPFDSLPLSSFRFRCLRNSKIFPFSILHFQQGVGVWLRSLQPTKTLLMS